MKSRFDMLSAPGERRNLAMFRSSGAVGIVLMLLVVAAVVPAGERSSAAPAGDTLALEIGTATGAPPVAGPAVSATSAGAAAGVAARSGTDEFALQADGRPEWLAY